MAQFVFGEIRHYNDKVASYKLGILQLQKFMG